MEMDKKIKILINTPNLNLLGGVANHYLGLKPFWNEKVLYNPIGKTSNKQGSGIYRLPLNIIVFIWRIVSFQPDIILLNPSLSRSALIRDMIFLRIAKLLRTRVAIFFHGFDKSIIPTLNTAALAKKLNRSECVFVLAKEFEDILRSWGVTVPIHLTTTKVDDNLIKDFDINTRTGKIKNILFLSRIEKAKGIYEAADTFALLKSQHRDLNLTFVGDGTELANLKKYVAEKHLDDVHFTGRLDGPSLIEEYVKADILLFTSHGEGMPTVVLEAMAFGLPIVTRAVGGLCDFFEDYKMGAITASQNAEDFVKLIDPLLGNPALVKKISYYNHQYAKKHFMASTVARNVENILKQYV